MLLTYHAAVIKEKKMSNIEHDSLWKVVKFGVELEVGGVRLIEKRVMKEVFSWMDTTVVQIHCQGVTLLLDFLFFYHQAKRPVMLKHKYMHNNSRIIKIMIVASPDGGLRRKKSLSLLWYQ